MLRVFESGLALIVLWWLALTAANAGPPYRTDDPEPTPLGHYEFYTFSTGTVVRDDTSGSLPALELNYGLIPNGHSRSTHRRRSTDLPAARCNTATAIRRSVSSTGLSKRMSRVGDRKLPFSRSSNCQRVTKAAASEQVTSWRFFRCGFRRASATGPWMAVAAIGSTEAAPATRIFGSLVCCYSER
jgi:hypothetical protein